MVFFRASVDEGKQTVDSMEEGQELCKALVSDMDAIFKTFLVPGSPLVCL